MEPLSAPTNLPDRPVFREFEEEDFWRVPGYQRGLPHWRCDQATYFVTFRLADSIPAGVMERWERERQAWLHSRGISSHWQQTEPERFRQALNRVPQEERLAFERQQSRRYFAELDRCRGACVLRDREPAKVVADALQHFHGSRVWTGDYVVMPNHVHVIAQPFEGVQLQEWLYSVKRFSARRIAEGLKLTGRRLWQEESFDRVIRNRAELDRTREYISKNPKRLSEGEFIHHRAEWP
ncbi:MAG TPA: transposase [Prosthecobacter sp.]|nr:transposase [Prosthecobacter sp.]